MPNILALLLAAIGPAFFGAVGLVLLKRAAVDLHGQTVSDAVNGLILLGQSVSFWAGALFYCAAFIWLMLALPHVKVSQFFPLAVALNIILTTVAAWSILSESITLVRIAGLILIISGAILVSR